MKLPARPPLWLRRLYKDCYWNFPNEENKIYLTFDDGPTPELLPFILQTLDEYKVKATFFCVGNNIQKHPQLYSEMLSKEHVVANHTFNHLNGWKTPNKIYFRNIKEFDALHESNLFRPPYGRLRKSQMRQLAREYKIILWDVLSYDYDKNISPERCLQNVTANTRSGSVIVFHDNVKAERNLRFALPQFIAAAQRKGFAFDVLK